MNIFTDSTYQELMPQSKTFFNAAFLFGLSSGGNLVLATWITHPNEDTYETSTLLFTAININDNIALIKSVADISVAYPNIESPKFLSFVQQFVIDLCRSKQLTESLPNFYHPGMFKPIKVVTVTPKELISFHTTFSETKFIHPE